MPQVTMRENLAPPSNLELLIHMGAGGLDSIRTASIRNYHLYENLEGALAGAFTVSVFAATNGVTEREITDLFEHKQYGSATYQEVSNFFTVWPTTISDTLPDLRIQQVHFDIVLPVVRPVGVKPLELSADELAILIGELYPHITRVIKLFSPRVKKAPQPVAY